MYDNYFLLMQLFITHINNYTEPVLQSKSFHPAAQSLSVQLPYLWSQTLFCRQWHVDPQLRPNVPSSHSVNTITWFVQLYILLCIKTKINANLLTNLASRGWKRCNLFRTVTFPPIENNAFQICLFTWAGTRGTWPVWYILLLVICFVGHVFVSNI